jgi:hypothetical protein
MRIRCADQETPSICKKLAITSPSSGDRSVCVVRSRTQIMEFSLVLSYGVCWESWTYCPSLATADHLLQKDLSSLYDQQEQMGVHSSSGRGYKISQRVLTATPSLLSLSARVALENNSERLFPAFSKTDSSWILRKATLCLFNVQEVLNTDPNACHCPMNVSYLLPILRTSHHLFSVVILSFALPSSHLHQNRLHSPL